MSIIRDMYSGDYMARIMSFVTVVFILVPVIAPAMGKFILDYYNWHGFSIFRCSSGFFGLFDQTL
jgi:DHA1 family bicyclomycin/chloramphenicol resistance-like MFS transporter